MKLQVLVSALTRGHSVWIEERSRCRRDQEYRRWSRAGRYNLLQLQHHLRTGHPHEIQSLDLCGLVVPAEKPQRR